MFIPNQQQPKHRAQHHAKYHEKININHNNTTYKKVNQPLKLTRLLSVSFMFSAGMLNIGMSNTAMAEDIETLSFATSATDISQLSQSTQQLIKQAQQTVVHLGTTVVTATRSPRDLKDSPIPITVIGKKQLQENQARTLKDALALLPNVILRPVHGKTGYEIIMQGLSANQVLVLIDGLPITASKGSTVNLNQYLNVQVEQIEIVQGASSSLYGSSAMGGVINVITKRLNQSDTETAYRGHITAEVGSNGQQNPSTDGIRTHSISANDIDDNKKYIDASVDARLNESGTLQGRLSASLLDDKGLQQDTQQWQHLKDASNQRQISTRLQYSKDPQQPTQRIWLEANHYEERDVSRFNRRVAQNLLKRQREEDINKNNAHLGFSYLFDEGFVDSPVYDLNVQGKLFVEDYDSVSSTYAFAKNTTNANNTDVLDGKTMSLVREATLNTQIAQLQADLPTIELNDHHTHDVQIGSKWQQDSLTQDNNGTSELTSKKTDRQVSEVYLQDSWLIGDNLEILTGVRYQNDSDFGSHTAPKIAIKYNHADNSKREHIFRASIGQGYRVPNLKERHFVFDHSVYGYKVMGNQNLQPETSDSFQLGYESNVSQKLTFTTNAYYNRISDLIQTDRNNPTRENNISIYHYLNVDDALTYGGDVGVNWQVSKKNNLTANYSASFTKNEQTDTALLHRPKHKVSVYLKTQFTPKFSVINDIKYEDKHLVSSQAELAYSPAWWLWNAKANYHVTDDIAVHCGISNILNTQRDVTNPNDQGPIDNRQITLGAKVIF